MKTRIFHEGDVSLLEGKMISIIGFGNQARAIALNLRDSGMKIIIAPHTKEYLSRAQKDNFQIEEIPKAIKLAEYSFILTDDDFIINNFENLIKPSLEEGKTLIFANGYLFAYNKIQLPITIDVLLLTPKVPGIGIRENYLTKKGFFTFISVIQDSSQNALKNLLALVKMIGGLKKGAIEVTPKQQTIMKLFSTQTFTYALIQIMMRSILRLVDASYPPEAIFVELILSGEGGFTVDKMIEVGMIKQMNYHSQTSQYGQMSRGMKFRQVAKKVEIIQRKILQEIKDGTFVKEWEKEDSEIKLDIMKNSLAESRFSKVEHKVRKNLNFDHLDLLKGSEIFTESEIARLKLAKFQQQVEDFYGGM